MLWPRRISVRARAVVVAAMLALVLSGCSARENVPAGGECDADDECLDKRCHQGLCLVEFPKTSGDFCDNDGQCRSSKCEGGRCVNNSRDIGDACLYTEECTSLSCKGGACSADAPCGDRIKNGVEQCDGAALGGETCVSQGFDGGELDCSDKCRFDTSGCVDHGWVKVGAGSFTMGSPASEPGRGVNETPHEVTLTRDFEIAPTEVTQQQFKSVRRYNPAKNQQPPCDDGRCPVENITWSEAAAYCNALSAANKLAPCYRCEGAGKAVRCSVDPAYGGAGIYSCPGYRLPTDAEWEYAYRAGSSDAYYGGLAASTIGWHKDNSGGTSKPVRGKQANAWKLYDMGGNVWEWCNDRFTQDLGSAAVTDPAGPSSGQYRVTRGGSWRFEPTRLRGASRLLNLPTTRYDDVGFRCARTLGL